MPLNDVKFDTQELDLREELKEMFEGRDFGNSKDQIFIHRAARLDSFGDIIRCTCFNPVQKEGAKGCPYCDQYGFLWDEHIISGFMYGMSAMSLSAQGQYEAKIGRSAKDAMNFITLHTNNFRNGDRLLEPQVTDNGEIYVPVRAKNTWYVQFTSRSVSDFGREEFCHIIINREM